MSQIQESSTVSLLAEVPEELQQSLQTFLSAHPGYDQARVFTESLALFLLQNGCSTTPEGGRSYRRAARIYLDSMFRTGK